MKTKTKHVQIAMGHVAKLKASYDRLMTPQQGPKPKVPARFSLDVIRCMDDLNVAFARYMRAVQSCTDRLAPDVQAIKAECEALSDEVVELDLVVVDVQHLVEWGVYIDPEATYILRAHGLLEDNGQSVREPEFAVVEG